MAAKKKKLKKKVAKKRTLKKKVVRKAVIKKKIVKKAPVKKAPAKKKAALAKKKSAKAGSIGAITHYFPKVRAAVIKLSAPLAVGDNIRIKGHTTDFVQNISSMQLDHVSITSANKGQEIGLLVDSRVRQHDLVFKEK